MKIYACHFWKIRLTTLLCILVGIPRLLIAQQEKKIVIQSLDSKYDHYSKIAQSIWENPELGFLEVNSSALLQNELENAGFTISKGVAGIPTAFTATFGSGNPVLGILGEFDALPNMSQSAVPRLEVRVNGAPGHACGHHLLGTGSMAAAIAIKEWLVKSRKSGTIRYYGTPAEEGGSGKVYIVRAGLFNDLDAVIAWHPWDANLSSPHTTLANISGKFKFTGKSSHATSSPELGRSALDGVEAMNNMVNLMRKLTTESTKINYVITKGGNSPNVIPAEAEVYYTVRHENRDEVKAIWNRILKAADGAALGTETKVTYEIISGVYDLLPNEKLYEVMYENFKIIGGINYTKEEKEFAKELIKSLSSGGKDLESAGVIQPMISANAKVSSDAGDVSWNVPTAEISAATWVPGTSTHSWQAVAAGGTSIGYKGMMVASKVLALTAIDIYSNPSTLDAIKAEFNKRRGPNFKYEALLGDRTPALDYRK
jgi:aminobenzoyl-glutamate utilization protein B